MSLSANTLKGDVVIDRDETVPWVDSWCIFDAILAEIPVRTIKAFVANSIYSLEDVSKWMQRKCYTYMIIPCHIYHKWRNGHKTVLASTSRSPKPCPKHLDHPESQVTENVRDYARVCC